MSQKSAKRQRRLQQAAHHGLTATQEANAIFAGMVRKFGVEIKPNEHYMLALRGDEVVRHGKVSWRNDLGVITIEWKP